jgi:hypothetical protein
MIEAILIGMIMFDLFWLGWLANYHPDPGHRHSGDDCCINFPKVPDTPQELLNLAKNKPHRSPSPSMWS